MKAKKRKKNKLCPKVQQTLDEINIDANRITKFTELWDWPEDFKKKHGI